MAKIPFISVLIAPNNVLILEQLTLNQVTQTLLLEFEIDPLLISFKNTKLGFDKEEFTAFLNNQISEEELITNTTCHGLFKNKTPFISKNTHIDQGSLWYLKNNSLFLVDKDRTVITKLDETKFEEIS